MLLGREDIAHLRTGAVFNACAADPEWCYEEMMRIYAHMERHGTAPRLCPVDEFDEDALIVAVGFVNNGLPLSELRPVGDEFRTLIGMIEDAMGAPVAGLMPLAAGNANAIVPLLVGMQSDLPVVDADPMGRILPLVSQTVFTLAGLPVGPVAAAGATGESTLVNVRNPARAERLLRALAGEFGGWAATATYPMTAGTLARSGVLGSLSRLMHIGQIIDSGTATEQKHEALRRSVGVQQIIRARVGDEAWLARPTLPGQIGRPASVVLVEERRGRLVQLEVQSELLMLMIDGAVRAAVPDIISLLRPVDCSVAGLGDLWTGNTVDIVVLHAPEPWYTPEGMQLAGPAAFNLSGGRQ